MGLVHHTNIVTDGLIGCWDVGNRKSYPGTGDDWGDLVNSVTATGETSVAPLFSSEPWAGTFLLDGTDDYFAIPDADLEVVGAFTFSVWLRFTTATPAGAQGYVVFTIRGGSGWDAEFALSILNHSWISQSVRVGCKGLSSQMGRWNANKYSPNENYNVWRNYCGVYNGSDPDVAANFKFYFDGVDAGTHDAQYNWGVTNNETRWAKDGDYYGYMGGYLGTIHLHNRALTAAEIKQNYEAVKPRFTPRITKSGMLANWDAGDPESYVGGTTLKDTANHYDGTFVNNGSGGDVSFDSANGGSLVFDGSDDYVNITTLPNCSSLARSAIIWVAVDDWPTSDVPQTPFQSAADQFHISFGVTLNAIYFNGGGSTASTAQKYVTLSPVPADGAWICWAMTIDSSGDIVAMYRNGVALTASGTSAGFSIKNKTTIGCRINTDNTTVQNPLDGKVGSVRLYTKTLSAAEVMENYQATRARFGL